MKTIAVPVAWAEIDAGIIIGVSMIPDRSSPFKWIPLYAAIPPQSEPVNTWASGLASQYGARQAAALRGDAVAVDTADHHLLQIAADHWHEIIAALRTAPPKSEPLYIIFDGPPAHESGRFVEVETAQGKSVHAGEWSPDGDTIYWKLGPFYAAPSQSELAEHLIPPPCCGEYTSCNNSCTPRGRWIAEQRMNATFDAIINAGSLGQAKRIAMQAKNAALPQIEPNTVSIRTADLPHKKPSTIIGGHPDDRSGFLPTNAAPEQVEQDPPTSQTGTPVDPAPATALERREHPIAPWLGVENRGRGPSIKIAAGQEFVEAHPPCTGANDPVPAAPASKLPLSAEQHEVDANWFVMMAKRRKDFLETHPSSSGVLTVREELAMFERAAGTALRAIELEQQVAKLCLPPSETLSEHPGCVFCMEAGTPVRPGQVCPKCGDRLPTEREYEADRLEQQLAGLKSEWFHRGQESVRRKNESGCCCKLDDDGDTILSACDAHAEWAGQQVAGAMRTIGQLTVARDVASRIAGGRTRRAEKAEQQLAEKDRGYAILHGQFVEMRNRWTTTFALKEKAEQQLTERDDVIATLRATSKHWFDLWEKTEIALTELKARVK